MSWTERRIHINEGIAIYKRKAYQCFCFVLTSSPRHKDGLTLHKYGDTVAGSGVREREGERGFNPAALDHDLHQVVVNMGEVNAKNILGNTPKTSLLVIVLQQVLMATDCLCSPQRKKKRKKKKKERKKKEEKKTEKKRKKERKKQELLAF